MKASTGWPFLNATTVGIDCEPVMLAICVVRLARDDDVLSCTGTRNLFWLVTCHVVIAVELERIARDWQISTARLRALLFAEGESLRSLVREQRVAWVLAQLARMEDAGASPAAAGFGSLSALQRACQDLIGLPPEIAGRALSLLSSHPRPPATTQDDQARQPRYRPYF